MATYTDLSLSLQAHPFTKDILKISDVDAVKQSMKNILFSGPYSSPFNTVQGADIRSVLFEQLTPANIVTIKRKISLSLEDLEPRAAIEDIYIGESGNNGINIGILFHVVGNPNQQTLNFTFERVR